MLNINSNTFSNSKQKANIGFGTNLIVDKSVIQQLNAHPEELKKILEFKEYLANDGKNWNAELKYDTFTPTTTEAEKLIIKQSNSYDFDLNKVTQESIKKMKPEEASALIEKLAQNPLPRIRQEAVEKIGFISDASIAADLIRKYAKGEDLKLRNAAVYSIDNINDDKVLISLIEEFSKSPDIEVKESVINATENVKDIQIRSEMLEKFANSDDAVTKKAVASSLNSLVQDNPALFDKLVEKLSSDECPEVREYSLCQLSDLDDEVYSKNSNLYDSIIEKGIKDTYADTRRDAAYSLGRLNDIKKAETLINEALKDEDEGVRRGAVCSIGCLKDSGVIISFVDKILKTQNVDIIENLGQIFRYHQNPKIANYIVDKLLNNQDPAIRKSAIFMLSDLKNNDKEVELTEKLLKDADSSIKNRAAWCISYLNDIKVRDGLINKYIKSEDINIRTGIAETVDHLAYDEPQKAKEFAQILEKDEDRIIQKKAKKTLEKIDLISKKDHYKLYITDGEKTVGKEQTYTTNYGETNLFIKLFNAYKSVVENFNV